LIERTMAETSNAIERNRPQWLSKKVKSTSVPPRTVAVKSR
jgi:hypothetical protein